MEWFETEGSFIKATKLLFCSLFCSMSYSLGAPLLGWLVYITHEIIVPAF